MLEASLGSTCFSFSLNLIHEISRGGSGGGLEIQFNSENSIKTGMNKEKTRKTKTKGIYMQVRHRQCYVSIIMIVCATQYNERDF